MVDSTRKKKKKKTFIVFHHTRPNHGAFVYVTMTCANQMMSQVDVSLFWYKDAVVTSSATIVP